MRGSGKNESKLALQAAQTRARLIETTMDLLKAHDFHQLSLDAIATKAGVTKGAIYFHFENKDALLMAALATRTAARPDKMVWPKREGSVRQRLRRLGEAILAQQEDSSEAALGTVKFLSYALSNESLKPVVVEVLRRTRTGLETNVRALFDPDELSIPVDGFAMFLSTLIPGLMFTRAFNGEQFNRETVLAIFEGLAKPGR
jgi:AcrR family transcriptional regulator